MPTIDPFSAAGAQQIAAIAGQQPAPIAAPTLNAPTMPPLPQPAPTAMPPAPAIPTLSDIFNTPETALDKTFQDASTKAADTGAQLAGEGAFRTQQETANDLVGKKATVTDLTSRLNSLKSDAEAIPLQVQQDFTGRGATAGGVAPIQTAQLRNNTIQQLGVSAMLNAANGNLSTAQDQVDHAVKAQFDPLKAELAAQQAQLAALTPLMNAQEKKQAEVQAAQLQARQEAITKQQADQSKIYDVMLKASQYGADSTTLRNIQSATSPEAAITAAGKYTSDPIAAQKALLDNRLTQANISKVLAEAQKATSTGGAGGAAGLSQEAIDQQAQNYLMTGKLSTLGNGGAAAKLAILNRAAELGGGPGGVPAAQAKYAAAANAVKTRTDSLTKMLASSSNLEAQFSRMTQLADQVNGGVLSGVAGAFGGSTGRSLSASLKNKYGDETAAQYTELINTIRSDYSSMQAAVAGSKGAEYFSRAADQAIPTGLTGAQYAKIYDTLKTSSDNARDAIQNEINKSLDSVTTNTAAATPQPGTTIEQNGMTFKVNADGTATRIK